MPLFLERMRYKIFIYMLHTHPDHTHGMGVSGRMFLLLPAHPGSPGQNAVVVVVVVVVLIPSVL